jgi:hypothetical protein
MAIEDFKQEIDGMFPCRWENDFIQNIRVTFDRYISIVSSIDGFTGDVLEDVKNLCSKLIEVLKLYYDGRKGEAFRKFFLIMNGKSEADGLFSSIDWVDINVGELYYRARERKFGENFSIQDMFHIPLNKRGIVSTQRFSSPGYPCLYLGNSVYSCWEELQRPVFNYLMFSAYKVRHTFRVFDMRLPSDSDYYPNRITQTIRRIPLVLACGYAVSNYNDVFKPEYIIPQMLVETIIYNNRKITQREKSAIDPDVIWGVLYTSTHISDDFPYGKQFLENIVLPVIESDNPSNYCYCLASLFDISRPLCYEYESLKENATRVFWETIDEEKTNDEKVREQYEQSKMGYLEERLRNSQFETLDYLVIDCPNEGIKLDSSGSPKEIKVRSSGPFTIK